MNTIISETIEAGQTNKVKFAYDNLGRVSSKTYTNSNNLSYVESYVYNSYGFLDQVKFNNTVVYDVSTMDTRGNITAASIGGTPAVWSYNTYGTLTAIAAAGVQSYLFNFNTSTGNLTSRTRTTNSLTETFTYDNSDRLTGATSTGATLAMGYDAKGNLTSKSDAGTLVYDNGKPYQLAHVNPYSALFSYQDQNITYTSYGQVKTISEWFNNATFTYNSDKQRVKMAYSQNGSVTKTKYYFGSSYEKEVSGTTTTEYIWIGGDAYTAVAVAKIVNGGTPQVWSIFRDHLGSITHLKNGTTVQEYSYDAWGRRRDKDTWSYSVDDGYTLFADRGFTGHEHLTEFGLINMSFAIKREQNESLLSVMPSVSKTGKANGRLYDPLVGRFLSPDNYVQDASNSQNFNRYGYCYNNPLVYTDPDGENPLIIAAFVLAGMYIGGAGVNSETGSFDLLHPELDPTKWKWKGEGAWKTYAGMIGGGAVGYLGGAMAVEYLAGDAAISLGLNFEGLVEVGAAFTKEGLQYLGYSTIAGGGLLVTGAAVNSWMKGDYNTKGNLSDNSQNAVSSKIWEKENYGQSRGDIINQQNNRSLTRFNSQQGGPTVRYVKDPLSNNIIDMRHMLIIGKNSQFIGNGVELFQYMDGQPSGRNIQDYYSNELGRAFYGSVYWKMNSNNPRDFSKNVNRFLNDPSYYYIRNKY